MALAHKQLAYETIPWRFTEKGAIASSGQKLVPVMVDGDRWIADSWIIANHLEDTYPDNPSLFGDSGARALTRHYSNIADGLVGAIFPFVALDILDHIAEPDRAYFRESREKRLGMPLETFVADREKKLPALQASLLPIRRTLEAQPFFGGDWPLYTTPCSAHSNGRAASVPSLCSRKTIRSGCGGIGYSTASMAWAERRRPMTSEPSPYLKATRPPCL
jgi:glutathione S-transferase